MLGYYRKRETYRQLWLSACSFPIFSARMRRAMYKVVGLTFRHNAFISHGVRIMGANVCLGRNAAINFGCTLDANGPIVLEDDVRIGFNCQLITSEHSVMDSVVRRDLGEQTIPLGIRISRGSWLKASVIVLPGVTIAEGCVIAPGAVVTKNTSPNGLYMGIPARRVRDLPTSGSRVSLVREERGVVRRRASRDLAN